MTSADTADIQPSLRKYNLNRGHCGISSPEYLWSERARMWLTSSVADQKGQAQLDFASVLLLRGYALHR